MRPIYFAPLLLIGFASPASSAAVAPQIADIPLPSWPTLVQQRDDDYGYGDHESDREALAPAVPLNAAATDRIVAKLQAADAFCDATPRIYRTSCLLLTYQQIVADMPRRGDYAEMREILDDAVDGLNDVMRQYGDRDRGPVRITAMVNGREQTRTGIRAVRADAVGQANAAAERVVAEAETRLLRSRSNDDPEQIHFVRIAEAVGSNKVLLRS